MAQRKSLPKTSIPRIFFIDKEIASKKYPNPKSLAEDYETSEASINRDIRHMRKMMLAPIAYDSKKKGFYYTDETFRLPAVFATAEDILAVELVKELMKLYRNTPIHDAASNLLETIVVPVKGVQNTKWYKDRIIVPKTITVPVNTKVWQCLLTGIKENRVVSFDYIKGNSKSFAKGEKKSESNRENKLSRRNIHPYQLLFDRGAWYLLCYDEDKEDKRIFFVSRISNIVLRKETFTLPADFDYRAFNGNSFFGVFASSDVYKFEIEVFGDTRWIQEVKMAEDQEIKETKNGAIVSFTSNQLNKVLDWILAQGAGARPIKPKILKSKWKETIIEMHKLI